MNKKTVGIATAAVIAIVATVWFVQRSREDDAPAYRFAAVDTGSVQQTVSATGALSAVKTVQVGTQVSGQVSAILVDFNDRVKKGELLAQIDSTLQGQAVRDAQAQLEKTQAESLQAKQEYDRNLPLFQQKFISATEFGTVQVNVSAADADVKSAQVTLDKAKENLSYTNIYAPIDGVVVERDVDVGQTVAASLSAPQLFLIAQDLAQMQILAAVDESDIASIKDGQVAQFTVEAYPGRVYQGAVQQVRLESKLADNVVSYTVVVTVQNADGSLLPGMTATVNFIIASATHVLVVPNTALRFKPSAAELSASNLPTTAPGTGRGAGASSSATPARPRRAAAAETAPGAASTGTPATLWTLDATQQLKKLPVRAFLSDGQRTQVQGTGLAAGMQIIIGSALPTAASPAAASSTNPLSPQGGGGGRGGGGG